MRRFFTYVVPMILLNYYPALYFLDSPTRWAARPGRRSWLPSQDLGCWRPHRDFGGSG
jgi:hypothetical protein